MPLTAPQNLNKKRKAVQDGVFKAELNNFLMKELAEDGYSGVEIRRTPSRAEVILKFLIFFQCSFFHSHLFPFGSISTDFLCSFLF